MAHRLFVGIRPPESVRDALIDTMEGVEGARWQSDDQLHLTLRFVGELETNQANDLSEELSRLQCDAFDIAVAGVGHFARKGHPKALWAAITDSEPLRILHSRTERACRRAGCEAETRKFIPHITIARLNLASGSIADWMGKHGDLRTDAWRVDNFILYESHLGTDGSQYEPVMRYTLGR